MEEKDWYWQEDSFKLDAESPLAISRSLWDGLAQSEADSRSLFTSTPPTDEHVDLSGIVPSHYSKELEDSREFYADSTMHEGSPRSKRRRMLLFPASRDHGNSSIPALDTSMECMETHIENCGGPMIPSNEDFEKYDVTVPSSPNSLWFLRNDEGQFVVDESLEPASERWMSRCFLEGQGQGHQQQQQVVPVSDISGSCSMNHQLECEYELADSPSTSFGGPSTPGSRPSSLFAQPKSATPVAYPFNLLKPSRAQGDVTLTDINQRLSMPPSSRPSPTSQQSDGTRLSQAQAGAGAGASGSGGLSGKSVVHRTKIHTQGDGCITIMRTRG
ncbi:hypothetical protein R1sor_019695 [Riccia sorocarpa]|uniref:Protein XRI1 n=1 Tax=Riccia sorocarpa TaxID=122646 RepID=A0ABD3IDD7_9MARC